jgi:hypothetical protein
MTRALLCAGILVGLVCGTSGCGSGEVRGRIAGKIAFQGKPLSEGLVCFSNIDKGIHMTGDLKPDGTYEIITAKGAGLPLGDYRVRVRPPLEPLPMGAMPKVPKPKKYPNIPQKYREYETSGLTLSVKEGDNPFDVDMKP